MYLAPDLRPQPAAPPFVEASNKLAAETRALRELVGAKTSPTPRQADAREAQRRRGETIREQREQQKRRAFVAARQRSEAELVADPRAAQREVDRRLAKYEAEGRLVVLTETTGKAVDLGDGNYIVGSRAQRRRAAKRRGK